MLSEKQKQENVFTIFDDLIDSGASGDMELKKYIIKHLVGLRIRCARVFGSVDNALKSYGYDSKPLSPISFERVYDVVSDCFRINSVGHVVVDFDLYLEKINTLQSLNYDVNDNDVLKQVTDFLALDRIEGFMREHNEDAAELLDSRGKKYPENQLNTIIYKHYEDRKQLYKTYNIAPGMRSDYSYERLWSLCGAGSDFERIVKRVLESMFKEVRYHDCIDDCRPDFIVNNRWYDAKLSRSTALDSRNRTIAKYRNHTQHLVILYAIDDTNATDDRATFVNITEFYPLISEELQREINDFIRKASAIKYGGAA